MQYHATKGNFSIKLAPIWQAGNPVQKNAKRRRIRFFCNYSTSNRSLFCFSQWYHMAEYI